MTRKGHSTAAILFLLPYGVLFAVFVLAPALYGFYISLHKWHILARHVPFVGFQNYHFALQDDLFRTAFVRTAYFVAMVVPLGNALSLLLAVGLTQNFRGTTLYKVGILYASSVGRRRGLLWRWPAQGGVGHHQPILARSCPLRIRAAPDVLTRQSVNIPWLNNPPRPCRPSP